MEKYYVDPKKIRKKKEWAVRCNLKDLRKKYWPSVTLKVLEDALDRTKPYYLNSIGLSVDWKGNDICDDEIVFKWGVLEGCKTQTSEEEQLYVWASKSKDGKFRYTRIGTRKDFDKMIAKKIKNNKTR